MAHLSRETHQPLVTFLVVGLRTFMVRQCAVCGEHLSVGLPTKGLLQLSVHDQGQEGLTLPQLEVRIIKVVESHQLGPGSMGAMEVLSHRDAAQELVDVEREQIDGYLDSPIECPVAFLVVVTHLVVEAPVAF